MKGRMTRQLRFAESVEPTIHNLNDAPSPPRDDKSIGAQLSPPPSSTRHMARAASSPVILTTQGIQPSPPPSPSIKTGRKAIHISPAITTRKDIPPPPPPSPPRTSSLAKTAKTTNSPKTTDENDRATRSSSSPAVMTSKEILSPIEESPPQRKADSLGEDSESVTSYGGLAFATSDEEQMVSSLYESHKDEQSSVDDFSTDESLNQTNDEELPVSLIPLHRQVYAWYKKKRPSMEEVSAFVARNAPCFWCWCCLPRLERGSVSDRSVLFRLNVLCAIFALVQVGSAIFLVVVLFARGIADRSPVNGRNEDELNILAVNLWNNNGSVFFAGIMGVIIFITMIASLGNVKHINLIGSIRYMWALLWFLPVESLVAFSFFDWHRVTDVWIRHYWSGSSMAWFRDRYCAKGTSRTLCVVPVCGLPLFGRDTALPGGGNDTSCLEGELAWCESMFNASSCTAIRDRAQDRMETGAYLYYTLNGIWAILLCFLLALTVYRLQSIVTQPIVQRSRESNVPGWLLLPIVACTVAGCVLLFSQTSVLSLGADVKPFWIGTAYLACAGLFALAALLGWSIKHYTVLNSRDLTTKSAAIILFIATMITTTALTASIFASSIAYSVDLVDFPLSDSQRGTAACFIDSTDSCSFCNSTVFPRVIRECPQWTSDEVVKVLRTQLKSSAVLSGIVLMYSFGVVRFGFVLRRHVSQYQIDYV